ncbi:hypothetical protein GGX14DRAFT_387616 [Mycena pura]|uniref:Uncharacterized protein n=1 Tax=Mycena pura TaxID=153505 RepID=A0AAD6YM77_9AGAR|nr:hypothetical protein GGX14DRAFT_387616 [Mycena pura]
MKKDNEFDWQLVSPSHRMTAIRQTTMFRLAGTLILRLLCREYSTGCPFRVWGMTFIRRNFNLKVTHVALLCTIFDTPREDKDNIRIRVFYNYTELNLSLPRKLSSWLRAATRNQAQANNPVHSVASDLSFFATVSHSRASRRLPSVPSLAVSASECSTLRDAGWRSLDVDDPCTASESCAAHDQVAILSYDLAVHVDSPAGCKSPSCPFRRPKSGMNGVDEERYLRRLCNDGGGGHVKVRLDYYETSPEFEIMGTGMGMGIDGGHGHAITGMPLPTAADTPSQSTGGVNDVLGDSSGFPRPTLCHPPSEITVMGSNSLITAIDDVLLQLSSVRIQARAHLFTLMGMALAQGA